MTYLPGLLFDDLSTNISAEVRFGDIPAARAIVAAPEVFVVPAKDADEVVAPTGKKRGRRTLLQLDERVDIEIMGRSTKVGATLRDHYAEVASMVGDVLARVQLWGESKRRALDFIEAGWVDLDEAIPHGARYRIRVGIPRAIYEPERSTIAGGSYGTDLGVDLVLDGANVEAC